MAEDRNQTIKKQLLKKQDEAARRKVPLLPGEMVDDAVARGMAGISRWLRKNFGVLQWFVVAAIVAGIGYAIYDYYAGKRADAATAELVKAIIIERGHIVASNSAAKSSEDEGPGDMLPVFKSAEERRETALASYRKVSASYPGTGAAILARLGEAGLLLDKRDWDGALAAYRDVRASPLAAADISVRGRALEGIGLALESKGDIDGALKAFRELENTDVRGLKELGMYQQARILFAKGEPSDVDKAKELLKGARERLKSVGGSGTGQGPFGDAHPFAFLESQVDDLLRRIDPSALVTASPVSGEGKQLTSEGLRRLQEQLKRKMSTSPASPPPGSSAPTPPESSP